MTTIKSFMNKFGFLLLVASLLLPISASAQLLDAIRGHAQDLKARFESNQKVEGEILKRGQIDKNAKGQDLIHNSSGEWTLVKVGNQLFLQSGEDFRSSPGPDYHIYISSKPAIKDNDEFSAQQIEVSRIKKPNGAAFYLLKTHNPEDVNSVLIWCKQFKEYIGSADLVAVR
ncbi:hypothetical protein PHIN9_15550 [Polynucleobacter sp. HIN9]|nr:hypothetical protein PHIN9_15550 [Polynucleobacter sp. HIN9]